MVFLYYYQLSLGVCQLHSLQPANVVVSTRKEEDDLVQMLLSLRLSVGETMGALVIESDL